MAATAHLGPDDGQVQVLTYREGLAQKAGHDLVIDVRAWSATVERDDAGGLTAVTLDVDSTSLHVREGRNGVKPLSDRDRAQIRKTIDAKILHGRPIAFRSTRVDGTRVSGELSVDGTSRPADFTVELAGDRLRGTLPVVQTTFGIEPYRGLLGALKVRDQVDVVVDVAL